jgi:transcription termination factor NusB
MHVIKYLRMEIIKQSSRNKNQEIAMILIYDALTYVYMGASFDVEKLITDYLQLPYEEVDIYIKQAVIKSLRYKDDLISQLEANMKTWKFTRLNRLAQAILLLAMTHFRHIEKVDRNVVIDVAVRQAKRYLDDDDYKFINGLLDKTL